jgi:hypothetical protein
VLGDFPETWLPRYLHEPTLVQNQFNVVEFVYQEFGLAH